MIVIPKRRAIITGPFMNTKHALNRGLVGWWLQLATLRNTGYLFDLTQHRNHGTLFNNPVWTTQVRKNGFRVIDYDGSTANIQADNVGITSVPFTLSLWARPDVIDGSTDVALSIGDGGATTDYAYIGYRNDRGVFAAAWDNSAFPILPYSVSAGDWHYITFVAKATNDWELYVDGLFVDGDTTSCNPTGFTKIAIGNLAYSGGFLCFNGQLDDIRVYNRALAKSEVNDLYKESLYGNINILNQHNQLVHIQQPIIDPIIFTVFSHPVIGKA